MAAVASTGSEGAQGPPSDEVVILHKKGDVVLVVSEGTAGKSAKFLVHSEVLQAASDYFTRLFNPFFKEGDMLETEECPEIELKEDDPAAMKILLSLVHFKDFHKYETLTLREIHAVAKLSDKYLFNDALKPWCSLWASISDIDLYSPKDYGLSLAIAHLLFDNNTMFNVMESMVHNTVPHLDKVWSSTEFLENIPQHLIDIMKSDMLRAKSDIMRQINQVERELRKSTDVFDHVVGTRCISCFAFSVNHRKRCSECIIGQSEAETCTMPGRILEFFDILCKEEIWPSFKLKLSISEIKCRIKRIPQSHNCSGSDRCPLKKQLTALSRNVQGMTVTLGFSRADLERR
ncbi:hypothetical protein PT974_07134 [Cladobotryum mycophilum]|uniref:BTB domain-containing protein n=1 Tax=Cladobotryum mycophilum TaxID=491253 RepID=A0ABR0SNM7_9HYPO